MDLPAALVSVGIAALVAVGVVIAAFAVWLLVQVLLRLTPSHRHPPPPAPTLPPDYERYGR